MTSRKDVQKVSLKVSLKVCFLSSDLDNTARINAIIKQITVYDRTTISNRQFGMKGNGAVGISECLIAILAEISLSAISFSVLDDLN